MREGEGEGEGGGREKERERVLCEKNERENHFVQGNMMVTRGGQVLEGEGEW